MTAEEEKIVSKWKKHEKELAYDMDAAGTFRIYMRHQIKDAADTIDTIQKFQRLIAKEPIGEEMKTGNIDTKKTAHPLIQSVNQLKNTLAKQLGYLGLNYSSQKKAESSITPDKKDENDTMAEYFGAINS